MNDWYDLSQQILWYLLLGFVSCLSTFFYVSDGGHVKHYCLLLAFEMGFEPCSFNLSEIGVLLKTMDVFQIFVLFLPDIVTCF